MEWIVSLVEQLEGDPLQLLAKPPAGASLVELRADLVDGIDLDAAVRECPLPLLITLRSAPEGGQGPDDAALRRDFFIRARDAGPAMIDLEADRDAHLIAELGLDPARVVLSWHDPTGTPDNLEQVIEQMMATPARWIKVIPTATSLADLTGLLVLQRRLNPKDVARRRLITFAMGEVGLPSRFLAPLLGPPLMYTAWSKGAAAAPGQLTINEMDAVIGHLNGAPQRLYGVVGGDVSRSLSPRLHSAAYRHHELPFLFVPVSVCDPGELDRLFCTQGSGLFDEVGLPAHGWAVTTPYKEQAARAATLAAPRVRTAAAANTLVLKPDKIIADNTDADGVVGSLKTAGVSPWAGTALVQGTGGAARGAAVGLHLAGAEVLLRSRDGERSTTTAAALGVTACAPDEQNHRARILVNATPLGSVPGEPSPFSEKEIASALAVVDMVYASHTTALAGLCDELGVRYIDGRDMLLHQGCAQFAAFTGRPAPKEIMSTAIRY